MWKNKLALFAILFLITSLITVPFSANAQNTYYVYVDDVPSWADNAGNAAFTATEFWMDSNDWLNFYKASSPTTADIHIKWVKEFGTETVGQAVDRWFVEVGLGDSVCYKNWQPFSTNYVNYITTHEIGHVLGLQHTDDPDSIMYPIANNLEYGVVEQEYTLTENYGQFIGFCTVKDVTSLNYWVSADDPTYGFDVYVVPSVDSFYDWSDGKAFKYYSNEGCFEKNFISFGGTCARVSQGSGLLVIMNSELTNPLTKLTVKMQELATTGSFSQPKITTEKPSIPKVVTEEPPIPKLSDILNLDTDNDGINDYLDSCKFVAETYNGYLDTDGCPDTKPIVIPEHETKSAYKDKASFSQSTYKTKIDKLKSGIETAENSLSGLIYQSPDAQKKIEQAWKIRWSALEKLDQANEKWKIGVSEIDKQNFRTAISNFKRIDADSESIGIHLKWISSAIENAEKIESEFQSQKKSISPPKEDKFCFLWWCW